MQKIISMANLTLYFGSWSSVRKYPDPAARITLCACMGVELGENLRSTSEYDL
jgi:hypothetical protein